MRRNWGTLSCCSESGFYEHNTRHPESSNFGGPAWQLTARINTAETSRLKSFTSLLNRLGVYGRVAWRRRASLHKSQSHGAIGTLASTTSETGALPRHEHARLHRR